MRQLQFGNRSQIDRNAFNASFGGLVTDQNNLDFVRLLTSDAGDYGCIVTNGAGFTVSHVLRVQVTRLAYYSPAFLI